MGAGEQEGSSTWCGVRADSKVQTKNAGRSPGRLAPQRCNKVMLSIQGRALVRHKNRLRINESMARKRSHSMESKQGMVLVRRCSNAMVNQARTM